jgi:hypothetical protein
MPVLRFHEQNFITSRLISLMRRFVSCLTMISIHADPVFCKRNSIIAQLISFMRKFVSSLIMILSHVDPTF